jgi:hypothetical protein
VISSRRTPSIGPPSEPGSEHRARARLRDGSFLEAREWMVETQIAARTIADP